MEVVTASLGIAELTARTSSKLWKLCDQWRNAPRDVIELRDEVDRAGRLYATVKSRAVVAGAQFRGQSTWSAAASPVFGPSAASSVSASELHREHVPPELAEMHRLLVQGTETVSKLQELISQLLLSDAPWSSGDAVKSAEATGPASMMKRKRLAWMRHQTAIKHSKRCLRQNTDQVGVELVLLNLLVTTNLSNSIFDIRQTGETVLTQGLEVMSIAGSDSQTLVESSNVQWGESQPATRVTSPLLLDGHDGVDTCTLTTVTDHAEPQALHFDRDLDSSGLEKAGLSLPYDCPCVPYLESASTRLSSVYSERECDAFCRCSCHSPHSPWVWSIAGMKNVLGTMSIAMRGFDRRQHSDATCISASTPRRASVEYRLPSWLASTLVSLTYSSIGPELLLRARRTTTVMASESPSENIAMAIFQGDIESVKKHLRSRVHYIYDEYSNIRGMSSVHIAVGCRKPAITKLLLQAGADPYQPDHFGHDAASHAFRFTMLGPDTGGQFGGVIPFERHIEEEGYPDLHRVLLGLLPLPLPEVLGTMPRFRAQVNTPTPRTGIFPLDVARDADAVRLLCEAGADPNLCLPLLGRDRPRLLYAANMKDLPVLRALLIHGADPNVRGPRGYTALIRAANYNMGTTAENVAVINLLLRHGADPDAVACATEDEDDGDEVSVPDTALLVAAGGASASRPCLELLLRAGADPALPCYRVSLPLLMGIARPDKVKLAMMLRHGVSYQGQLSTGFNVLHCLAKFGSISLMPVFECLDYVDVDPHRTNHSGQTALQLLAERPDAEPEFRLALQKLIARIAKGEIPIDYGILTERERVERVLFAMPEYVEMVEWLDKWLAEHDQS